MLFPYTTAARWRFRRFATQVLVCGVLVFCASLDGLVCLSRYRRCWYYRPKHSRQRGLRTNWKGQLVLRHRYKTRFAVKYGLFWHSGLLTIRFLHANMHGGVNI